nr:hypothetical protein [Tanacetum cinerariifolium]
MLVHGLIFQGEGSTVPVESHHTPTCAPSTSQPHLLPTLMIPIKRETEAPQPSSPLHTNVADEAASIGVDVRHRGDTTIVTSLDAGQGSGNINKTPSMPYDLPLLRVYTLGSDDGRIQHNELMNLVTKLSDRVVALETDLKQTKKVYGAAYTKLITKGRKIDEIDQDPNISLIQHDAEIQGRYDQDMEFILDFDAAKKVSTAEKEVSTAEQVSTAGATVTTASVDVSPASSTRRVYTVDNITMAETLVYISGGVHPKTKRLQAEEKNKYNEVDQAKILVDLFSQRKRYFSTQKAKAKRNKPMTQAQQMTYMSNYIKHMGSHTLQQLRRYSFDELKTLFEITIRRVNTFVPMETEDKGRESELIAGSSQEKITDSVEVRSYKRAAEAKLDYEGEGSTVPVESHHTPTCAPSTSQPHLLPTLMIPIRQETEAPQPSSPLHTNVADEAASIGVDVRHRGATTIVTSLDAGLGS